MRRLLPVAVLGALLAIVAAGGSDTPSARAAPPACSLPKLTQDKLDEGAHRVALYRKRRKIEFSNGLQGFPPPKGKLSPHDALIVAISKFFREVFGLNRSTKLIRALLEAHRRGSDRVVFIVGLPVSRMEKKILSFTVFAFYSAERLDLYGQGCAPGYAGFFFEGFSGRGIRFAVRFKEDRDAHAEALKDQFALWPLLDFLGADYSLTELNQINRQIGRDRDLFRKRRIRILLREISPELNAILIFAVAPNPNKATAFFDRRYGDAVEVLVLPRSLFFFLNRKVEARHRLERKVRKLRERVARELTEGPG